MSLDAEILYINKVKMLPLMKMTTLATGLNIDSDLNKDIEKDTMAQILETKKMI